MTTRAIAVLGTASHVGKTVIAAGICRLLARRGLRVAPFKAQNMSNNAAVALGPDGEGEIARAQALQARAARVAPVVEMNPVLLKPCAERSAEVVVLGRARGRVEAAAWPTQARCLWPEVAAALDRLCASHDAVVIEGAGSCAEVNLPWEIANWPPVRAADADVILVADIDRGGVFAQVIGTLDLLAPEDRSRVAGVIVNRFRGEPALFGDGVRILEDRTGVPVLGVLPWLDGLGLDEEDSVGIPRRSAAGAAEIEIAVVATPRIANFTDLAPLGAEPDVGLVWIDVAAGDPLGAPDVVVLPGSKAVLDDLAALERGGYLEAIRRAAAHGAEVVGLCGGLEMLGTTIADPGGLEGSRRAGAGLGLLALETTLGAAKTTRRVTGRHLGLGAAFDGYEIHRGVSAGEAPVVCRDEAGRPVGWGDDRVWGTYVHGIFDAAGLRRAWLDRLRARKGLSPIIDRGPARDPDAALDRLADALERHVRLPGVSKETFASRR